MRRVGMGLVMALAVGLFAGLSAPRAAAEDGWITLFDGTSLDGWKASENTDAWSLADGILTANGKRSHLFYEGDQAPFKNFELKVEVMAKNKSNSGVFIHTKWQDQGWPSQGYEIQVNNTGGDPQKTGGIYAVAKILEAPAQDDEWFTLRVRVEGKQIQTWCNDKLLVDYTEPDNPEGPATRRLSEGTFALQAHDPGSTVCFRKIEVKKLD